MRYSKHNNKFFQLEKYKTSIHPKTMTGSKEILKEIGGISICKLFERQRVNILDLLRILTNQ